MKFPTLKDRLKHPIKTEEEALLQLEAFNIVMSEDAKKKLEKYKQLKNQK